MNDVTFRHAGPAPAEAAPAAQSPGSPASPSARIVAEANARTVLTDSKGRNITVAPPEFLAQFRFIEAIGAEMAKNQVWVQMATPVLCVVAIDGMDVPRPMSKIAVEVLLQRLGAEGYEAVATWMSLAAPEATGSEDSIKNS